MSGLAKPRNPWMDWIVIGLLLTLVAVVVFTLVLLVIMVVTGGAPQFASVQVSPRVAAGSGLGLLAFLAFIFGMNARWERRHQ